MTNLNGDEIELYIDLINKNRKAKYINPVGKSEKDTKYYCVRDLLTKWLPFEKVHTKWEINLN